MKNKLTNSFKTIIKIIEGFYKVISFFIMILEFIALIGLIILFGLSFSIIHSGLFFVGIAILILTLIVVLYIALKSSFSVIFGKKNNENVISLLSFICFFTFLLGIGLTYLSLDKFELTDIKTAEIVNDGVTINMSDNTFIPNEYTITYVEEERSNIKVLPVDITCSVRYKVQDDGSISLNQDCNLLDKIKVVIKGINNNRIYFIEGKYKHDYTVFASKENIEKMQKNARDYYKE